MSNYIDNFTDKGLSGRYARIWLEWKELDTLCAERMAASPNPQKPSISYVIRRKNVMGLPTEIEIWYRCKSIIGVKDTDIPREPIFGYLHKMSIVLPNSYPSADGNPIFTFLTDVWHPNIRYSGFFKGHVRLPQKEMGTQTSLKDYVLLVECYLKYEQYHAKSTYPFPEDCKVATWALEEGESNGYTSFEQDMPIEKESQNPHRKIHI